MVAVPSIGRASRVERDAAPGADAASELYERYSHQVFGYCLHHLGSREEAEDAVQTTFMNAFRGLGRGIVPECEQAWLFKIAHNVCLSRRRSSWRRGRVEAPNNLEVLQEIVPAREKIADELISLQDVLEGMPENQRRAILLREWQGLSYREVAAELRVSQAAVETLIFRARRSLAAGLQEARPSGSLRKRLRRGADLGGVLAFVKTLFGGGGAAAIKVVAAIALAGAAVATTGAEHLRHQDHAPAPAVVPPAVADLAPATASVFGGASVSSARPGTPRARVHRSSRQVGAFSAPEAGASSVLQTPPQAPTTAATPTQSSVSGTPAGVAPAAAVSSDEATPAGTPQTPPGQSVAKQPSKPPSASANATSNNGKAKGKANGTSAATPAPPAPQSPNPAASANPGRGNAGQTGSAPSPDTTVPGNSGADAKGKATADANPSANGNGPPETPPGQGGEPRGNPGHDK